jgi:hypothetical protein
MGENQARRGDRGRNVSGMLKHGAHLAGSSSDRQNACGEGSAGSVPEGPGETALREAGTRHQTRLVHVWVGSGERSVHVRTLGWHLSLKLCNLGVKQADGVRVSALWQSTAREPCRGEPYPQRGNLEGWQLAGSASPKASPRKGRQCCDGLKGGAALPPPCLKAGDSAPHTR